MMEHETPLKRLRTAEPSAASHLSVSTVLSRLQQAVTSKQRVNALHQLLHIVGYDPSIGLCRSHTGILQRLVEGKCIHLLCLQLGYALNRRSMDGWDYDRPTNDHYMEQNLIVIALDVLYRHFSDLIDEGSIRNNGSEVLRLSREALAQRLGGMIGRNANRRHDPNHLSSVRSIISIWHSISSCSLGTMLLLRNTETLQIINTILSIQKTQSHQNNFGRIEIIMECLGLLKNLSYYGEDHRHLLVNQTDLISTLTSLTDVPSEKARERLSAVFRNLALSADVRSLLSQRADVLTAIVRVAGFCISNQHTHSNTTTIKNTLRNILSTVTSLAIDTSTTHLMVFHGDGVLIEQLKQFVVYGDDCVARKRAVRALRLLARDPSSTPVMILQNNQLLEILSDRALNDTNDSVRAEATEAFAKCSNLIRAPMAQHNYILGALTRMLEVATTKPPMTTADLDVVARALLEQASYQGNRRAMSRQRNLLGALANVLRSESVTLGAKESVCVTLVNLSEEKCDQEAIALPIILDALVQTLIMDQPRRVRASNDAIATASTNIGTIVTNRIRESSVQTLLNLAETPSNRTKMAQQTALIQSLLRFAGASTTSDNVKKQVKEAIIRLATEL